MTATDRECAHIFFVQSPISYLICEAIIRRENIDPDRCFFLVWRISRDAIPYASMELPSYFHSKFRGTGIRRSLSFFRWGRRIRAVMATASRGRPYKVYVNKLVHGFLSPVSNDQKCREINLYEEGLAAFWRSAGGCEIERKHLGLPPKMALPFWVRNRVFPAEAPYTLEYDRAFVSGGQSMAGFPRRTEVDLVSVLHERGRDLDFSHVGTGAQIYALPLLHDFQKDAQVRDRLIRSISDFLNRHPDRQHLLGLHPDYVIDEAFWDDILKRAGLTDGVKSTAIVSGLFLEVLAVARPDVSIYFVVSSLAAYDPVLDAELISYAEYVFGPDHWKVDILRKTGFSSFRSCE